MKLVFENEYIKVFHGSYIELTSLDYKFNAIITDPPYGMTNNKWDIKINFQEMWKIFHSVKLDSYTPMIMFGDFPFSVDLINSKRNWYRYTWYWNKLIGAGFLDSAYKPLKIIEHIHVFSEKIFRLIESEENYKKFNKIAQYYPQMTIGKPNNSVGKPRPMNNNNYQKFDVYYKVKVSSMESEFYRKGLKRVEKETTYKFPKNYLEFQRRKPNKHLELHPTEKPLALIEYLIKTYTKEDDLILDCFAGSGVTAIASMKLKRKCVLVEKEDKYVELILKRIKDYERKKITMASVACVECFGKWLVEISDKTKKDTCIHGIKTYYFCRECENKLQSIKEFCENNHSLNINFIDKKANKKEYMPTTTCDGCGGVAFVSDEKTPTCISCKGDTCQECGECDCECQCCKTHHDSDCEKCSETSND